MILGSGKMARNVGAFFLGKGHSVAWLSRDEQRLAALAKQMGRTVRRIARGQGVAPDEVPATFHTYEDDGVAPPDIIIENLNESLQDKRAAFDAVAHLANEDTLLLTNTSSIIPELITDHCVGMHFFYPAELSGFVEIVVPTAFPEWKRDRVVRFAAQSGLSFMLQSNHNAFVANRLLLALQAEVFRALEAGYPASWVDECSASPLLPMGQLSVMDAIGFDVLQPAVDNYVAMLPDSETADYAALQASLRSLLAAGKLGKKNGDGLMCGAALPWKTSPDRPMDPEEHLRTLFLDLFVNSCFRTMETGMIDAGSLEQVLSSVFQSDVMLSELPEGKPGTLTAVRLEKLYSQTGLSYFKPSGLLERAL